MKFTEMDNCERCGAMTLISQTKICRICLDEMLLLKKNPEARAKRLGELNRSANGIRMSIRQGMRRQSSQVGPPLARRSSSELREWNSRKRTEARPPEFIEKVLHCSKEEFASHRASDLLLPQVREVNDELMRWLSKHPEYLHELPPRKFEEVVCEILRDQGHQAHLTKETRDGGWDINAVIKTSIGELLVIVECKRWAKDRKVDLQVVERFLHSVRDKAKANVGLIATTTLFTRDARKHALEYNHLLKLADFNQIKEMASHYGKWHRAGDSGLWIPDYAVE